MDCILGSFLSALQSIYLYLQFVLWFLKDRTTPYQLQRTEQYERGCEILHESMTHFHKEI